MDKASPIHKHHHAVQFYENDSSLFATVAGFLSQGLVEGHPAILIATAEHTAAILDHLNSRMIDVAKARALGELTVLDAHQTLAMFMVDDKPDPVRFESSIGRVIGSLLQGRSERTLVRAYGEMVDVLWKDGREDAAIQLELLWNSLAGRYGFALLCGYAMGNFFKQTDRFEEVCRQHTHIIPGSELNALPKRDRMN
jgi:MEDS: MEthanogen/methylotroph, DcmR Sensory domain